MKKLLFLLSVLIALPAMAQEIKWDVFEHEGVWYKILDEKAKTCKTRDGINYKSINEVSGDLVLPKTVNYENETYTVIEIGEASFAGCKDLTSVTIPNTVISIGNNAFFECTGLTNITIPNTVISIGNNAFFECTGLTNMEVPNSVTSIGGAAFDGCKSLKNITLSDNLTSLTVFRGKGKTGNNEEYLGELG